MSLHIETPLIISDVLSDLVDKDIRLKLDALQPSGSFKIRGVGFACEYFANKGAKSFLSSSGGNAGMAVAYAGKKLGIPVKVIVPETTSTRSISLLKKDNAEVIIHGSSWLEANELAQSILTDETAFIHPFDDELLWSGHSTIIDEVKATDFKPDLIILSVGGAGLLAGVIKGLLNNKWEDTPIMAVETFGAASLNNSLKKGETVELDKISSLATSLGAKKVSEGAFKLACAHNVISVLTSDLDTLLTCENFLSDHKILVEPACGAALSPVYNQMNELEAFSKILVIVCGGSTMTIDDIREGIKTLERSA
jgi:L-serine/L-threonine ammonia-lyase